MKTESPSAGPRRRLLVLLLVVYLSVSVVVDAGTGQHLLRTSWHSSTDFSVFYAAGQFVTSSERAGLYNDDHDYWEMKGLKQPQVVGTFFYTPPIAYLFKPLTLLPYLKAKALYLGLQVLGAFALAYVTLRGAPSLRQRWLVPLVLASFWPLYIGFWQGQTAIFLAICVGITLVLLETKSEARLGAMVGLLALKTTFVSGLLGLLAWRRREVALQTAVAVGATLFAGPLLILGPNAWRHYLQLLHKLTVASFDMNTTVSVQPRYLTNWQGVWINIFWTDPSIPAIVFLDALTAGAVLLIWMRGTQRASYFAAIAGMILVTPHILEYDWLLLVPCAFALLAEQRKAPLVGLLLLLHFALNLGLVSWLWNGATVPLHLDAILPVVTLFAVLVYLAAEAWQQPRKSLPARVEPSFVPSTSAVP